MVSQNSKILEKSAFLDEPIVIEFIHYLSSLLSGEPIHHEFLIRDRKLPANDSRISEPLFFITSLEQAFNSYWWNGQAYDINAKKLAQIQEFVRSAMGYEGLPRSTDSSLDALREVLKWGAGGTGQKLYTSNETWALNCGNKLTESLRKGRNEMTSQLPNLDVFRPSKTRIYARMNAGFTKYYALACDDVIMYDGRVGAALGFLVKNFCVTNKIKNLPDELAFRWGAQNGKNPLNRNPSDLIFRFEKLPIEGSIWAEWNIKANWILSEARKVSDAAWIKGPQGLRHIEASLFVIGYSMPVSKLA
jgi:hypothetical protein